MKLAELGDLMTKHGGNFTLGDLAAQEAERATTVAEAMAQRMTRVSASCAIEDEAAECLCGLLLCELPYPTTVRRTVLVLGKPRDQMHRLAWAHIAPGLCIECWDADAPCPHHPAVMCHTPEPELCMKCDRLPSALGSELCRGCALVADGPQWEPDLYYGR